MAETKDELVEQAQAEGVALSGGESKADVQEALEQRREATAPLGPRDDAQPEPGKNPVTGVQPQDDDDLKKLGLL